MPDPTRCEMAQYHQPLCSRDNLLSTLIAAASHRYTPTAPSPLNPKRSGDTTTKPRKHAARPRRVRPARKKSVETPTERLLRRKAAIAYERSTQRSPPPRKDGGTVVMAARLCDSSEKRAPVTIAAKGAPPAGPKGTGPLVVNVWETRRDLLTDVERQSAAQLCGFRQRPAPRQRLEILLMLVLLSTCLTLLTVVGLDSLKGHYLAG